MLARIGRWPFRGKAARHLVYLEIAARRPPIVSFGHFGEAGMVAFRAFQLP